jgi:hypothetical protein
MIFADFHRMFFEQFVRVHDMLVAPSASLGSQLGLNG